MYKAKYKGNAKVFEHVTKQNTKEMLRFSEHFTKQNTKELLRFFEHLTEQNTKEMLRFLAFYKAKYKGNAKIL